MKFSIANLLMRILLLALSSGILLSDRDAELKGQASKLGQQRLLIEEASQFHLPVSSDEIERKIAGFQSNPEGGSVSKPNFGQSKMLLTKSDDQVNR